MFYSGVDKEGCLVGVFLQIERTRGKPKAVMGLHSGPGSKTHQAFAGTRKGRGEVGG